MGTALSSAAPLQAWGTTDEGAFFPPESVLKIISTKENFPGLDIDDFPHSFRLKGFSGGATSLNGAYVKQGPINGRPAYQLIACANSMVDLWCCYVDQGEDGLCWVLQDGMNKGSDVGRARCRSQPWESNSTWEETGEQFDIKHKVKASEVHADFMCGGDENEVTTLGDYPATWFTLSGFTNSENNGTFVDSGSIINGMPAYASKTQRWCCYDSRHACWKIQSVYNKGGVSCSAFTLSEGLPSSGGEWEEYDSCSITSSANPLVGSK